MVRGLVTALVFWPFSIAGQFTDEGPKPGTLLPLAAMLDSVAIVAAIDKALASPALEATSGQLLVGTYIMDSERGARSVRVLKTALPQAATVALATGLIPVIAARADLPAYPLTLEIGIGAERRVRLRRSRSEPPKLQNEREIEGLLGRVAENVLGLHKTQSYKMELWLKVIETGKVDELAVAESTGREDLDQLILTIFTRAQFRPLLLEGAPMATWIGIPATVSVR